MTINFDFITNDKFRSILIADSNEMYACGEVEAWKAVHVLAGSIIEAVIVDYLIAEGHVSEEKATKLYFDQTIETATEKKILSEKVRNLSIVVKDYRNLVHPGRSIRLQEIPDEKNSKVAMSLVEMICDELSNRKSSHGYTAEQIINKIWRDSYVNAILEDLLKETPSNEIRKLLMKGIPDTYHRELQRSGLDEENYHHVLPTLTSLFRSAYAHSDKETQREVSLNFVRILKEEDSDSVTIYSQAFWWTGQLGHLCDNDAQVVKKHFFSRIREDENNPDLINILSGIGLHLSPKEVEELVAILVRNICRNRRAKAAASRLLQNEYDTPGDVGDKIISNLEYWQTHFNETGRPEFASIVGDERASLFLNAIPF